MNSQLCEEEQKALNAAADYMKRYFNKNVNYASPKVKEKHDALLAEISLSPEESKFWDSCIQKFTARTQNIFHLWDMSERFIEEESDADINSEDSIQSEVEDTDVIWADPSPVQLVEQFCDRLIESYNFTSEQEESIGSLLDDLRVKVEKYVCKSKKEELPGILLSSTDSMRLRHMLNLRSSSVCKLLPYLLTSYTFNVLSKSNHFFYQDSKLLEYICGTVQDDQILNSAEAPKWRDRIKSLSAVFSLKPYKDKLITLRTQNIDNEENATTDENTNEESKVGNEIQHPRPKPAFAIAEEIADQEQPKPYILYKEILDQIFEIWCDIIENYGLPKNEQNNALNVDVASCRELYHFYTD